MVGPPQPSGPGRRSLSGGRSPRASRWASRGVPEEHPVKARSVLGVSRPERADDSAELPVRADSEGPTASGNLDGPPLDQSVGLEELPPDDSGCA
jgi:hypothetical protein